jgi:hypothetical protein
MAQWKPIKSIIVSSEQYSDVLEMANAVARENQEPVTSLSARLLRDALTKSIAEKGLKVNRE